MHGRSKTYAFAALSVAAALSWACSDRVPSGVQNSATPLYSVDQTGNGAPSGAHYNLNIIGVPHGKTADMTGSMGHVIFVNLNGGDTASSLLGRDFTTISRSNKIFLFPGADFQVLDANGTDASGASFQLPADVSTTWRVYARALGKPNGHADMTTCATVAVPDTNPVTGVITIINEVDCSLATLSITRTKNSKFSNVSPTLLHITVIADTASTATPIQQALAACLIAQNPTVPFIPGPVTLGLFSPCLDNNFWNDQNKGLRLLQLRFYPA